MEQQASGSGLINAIGIEAGAPGYVRRHTVSARRKGTKRKGTICFLDNGSLVELIRRDLVDELELPGPTTDRYLRLFNGELVRLPSRLVYFMSCSTNCATYFRILMGYTTPKVEIAERNTRLPEVEATYGLKSAGCRPSKHYPRQQYL